MLQQERNIVYEAAPPAQETQPAPDTRDYSSTSTVISKVAYLIGVPKKFFEAEYAPPQLQTFDQMEREKNARIIRNLCRLRTAIEQNYGRINKAFLYDLKNLHTLPEYIPQECLRRLSEDGIELLRANYKLTQYIIDINLHIANRINNCRDLLPLWLKWEYVRELFLMPNGTKEAGLKRAAEEYCANRTHYPYLRRLSEDGIELLRANYKLTQYIIDINLHIANRINNCRDLLPLWLKWEYVRELFLMPNGTKEAGLKRAAEEYCANRTHYPYQVYINWPAQEEQGNILHNDKKFITLLYEMHEDYFADFSKVSDAGSAAKAGIYQFLEGSRRTAIVVDCENSDPYKLYAMLNNLDQNALLGKIAKIILYDDVHTTTAWQILEKFTQIPVEHVLIERVKENKSLVDIRLTTGTCCEFFQNNIDSFLLASSDSDYWGLIPAMPQARFFVLVEAEKCSGAIRKAMENGGIAYCYLDRFCTGNSNQIKETAMLQAVQRILDEEVQLNLHDVMNEAYLQTRAGMTTAERRQFCERYLQHLRIEIDETGNLRLVVGK